MKLLIIEDDFFKYSKIESLVLDNSKEELNIELCDNVHDAVIFLNGNDPDKIILDMSLPSHFAEAGGGSPLQMPNGGIEVLLEIKRLKKTHIPIIILTQYMDIEIEYEYYSIEDSVDAIKSNYGITNTDVVYYENDSEEWVKHILNFMGYKI